ncbi:MAG: 16S rRNA (cytidine(1402)-2'-O)-methyltransferase [Ruminococcaceae bacterium]|nr:16S rRNA (cytidine(1402)-2'-O)-methyltransferase [Oscillospiraceae bacterium]
MSEFDFNSQEKNKIVGGMLYLVATPVGNLADLSSRAVKVLSEVDFIAAEDTRNSMRLLQYLGINKPMVSYFEHNRKSHGQLICDRLLSGESCALITDAGTPAISDPGEDIVALCAEKNIPVTSIPGACAAILSLTLSGLPTARFCFEGFLPMDKKERRERLELLSSEDRTMIFHEAPHKLINTLEDMKKAFGGDRRISLCRELTKLNEEVMRTTIDLALEYYSERAPRGEYVLVLEGCGDIQKRSAAADLLELSIEAHVQHYIDSGLSKMDAIKKTAKDRGVHKNEIYQVVAVKE